VTVPQDRVAYVVHGRELYTQTCTACHGSDGTGGIHGAPLKTTQLSLAELMTTIGNGRDQMPAFGRTYEAEDLHDVAAYILEELIEQ
jgi:mono/diheme cytochrome c family protein